MLTFADAVAGKNDDLYQVHVSWYFVLVRGNFHRDGLFNSKCVIKMLSNFLSLALALINFSFTSFTRM